MPEKCHKCSKEIVPPNPILKYSGNNYHSDCLTCSLCKRSLGGVQFLRDPKRGFVCLDCEEKHGIKCYKCKKGFKPGMSYKRLNEEQAFHSECFTCGTCNNVIAAEFYDRNGVAVCLDCHNKSVAENAKYCEKCSQLIKYKFIVYKEKPYHQECFQCLKCSSQLDGTTFYRQDNQEPICEKCHNEYLDANAKKCFKCGTLITDTGITFENNDYHDKCLTCTECNRVLDSAVLMDANRNLFCEQCYLNKFANSCGKCEKTINPTIECAIFEGKHYHKECFRCDQCAKQISDVEFTKKDSGFLCINCAQNGAL